MALSRIFSNVFGTTKNLWNVNCRWYYSCRYEIPTFVANNGFVSISNCLSYSELGALTGSELSCIQWRSFAKNAKDGKRNISKRGHGPATKITLSHEELNEIIDYEKMTSQMEAALEHLRKQYAEQLSLRTSVNAFDGLTVDTPDGQFPLIQVAQVLQKSPQLLVINMSSTPQYITHVKTAISASGLNVNPQQEGTTLYVPVPRVTHEHREMLAKNAKALCEKTKERLRHIQNSFDREVKAAKESHSADLIYNLHEAILATTKSYVEKARNIMETKQQELLNK